MMQPLLYQTSCLVKSLESQIRLELPDLLVYGSVYPAEERASVS